MGIIDVSACPNGQSLRLLRWSDYCSVVLVPTNVWPVLVAGKYIIGTLTVNFVLLFVVLNERENASILSLASIPLACFAPSIDEYDGGYNVGGVIDGICTPFSFLPFPTHVSFSWY